VSAGFNVIRWARDRAPLVRRDDGKADPTSRLVLLALATYANSSGVARPTLRTLAAASGLAERTAKEAVDKLTAAGLVEDAGDFNGVTRWRLRMDVCRSDEDGSEAEQRRQRRLEAQRERNRRYRERRQGTLSGDVSTECVTPHDSVNDAVAQRHVTPSQPSSPQVTTPVTAIELPRTATLPHLPVRESDERLFDVEAPTPAKKPGKGKTDIEAAFAEWWDTYPRKKDKQKGKAAYRRAVAGYKRDGETFPPTSPTVLLAAVKRLAADRDGEEKRFTPYPASWLNGRRWEDEDDTAPATAAPSPTTRETAREWLRSEWEMGRVAQIHKRTGIEYMPGAPPEDVGPAEVTLWHRDQRRAWISDNAEMLIDRLTTPRMAAST
jgi:hypothetical protein